MSETVTVKEPVNRGELVSKTLVIAPGSELPGYLSSSAPTSDGVAAAGTAGEIEHSRLSVLSVLFIVTGAFGLPLLWRSDRFSRIEKTFWSVLVTAYTAALFYGMIWMVLWSVGDILE